MNLLRLTALQLRINFGLAALAWYRRHDKKKFFGSLGIAALIIVGIGPIFYLYLRIVQAVYTVSLSFGQPQTVLTMSIVAAAGMVVLFGFAFQMSVLYFSDDLNTLIPLPLLPRDIMGAKFAVVLVNTYLTILPFFPPALWVYGVSGTVEGPLYWLTGLLIFLLLPVIPLTMVTVVLLVFMRATNLARRRDTLRLIGMVFFLVFILGLNLFLSRIPEGQEIAFIQNLLQQREGLVSYLARTYPPAILATRALVGGDLLAIPSLAAFAGLSLVGLAASLFLADRLFYRGLIGGQEVTSRRKLSAAVLDRRLARVSSPVRAIAERELKILLRTPIFMFNSVAVLLIVPISLVFPLLAGGGGGLQEILALVQNPDGRVVSILAGAAFIGGLALITPAASSAFSREGKLFWISQMIPVDPVEQVKAKLAYSLFIAAWGLPFAVAASFLAVHWTLPELLLVLVLGMAMSFPAISASLLVDLIRPYLAWDNPQKAIKQNMNVLFGMMAGGGILFGVFQTAFRLNRAGVNAYLVYLVVLGLSLLAGYMAYAATRRLARERYRSLGV